jgi:hypothetical protein
VSLRWHYVELRNGCTPGGSGGWGIIWTCQFSPLRPLAQSDGHDLPGSVDKIDDIVVGFEDAVREPIVAMGLITRTEDTPHPLKVLSPNKMGHRPGADCVSKGCKAQKRPTRLFGR